MPVPSCGRKEGAGGWGAARSDFPQQPLACAGAKTGCNNQGSVCRQSSTERHECPPEVGAAAEAAFLAPRLSTSEPGEARVASEHASALSVPAVSSLSPSSQQGLESGSLDDVRKPSAARAKAEPGSPRPSPVSGGWGATFMPTMQSSPCSAA